MVEKVIILLTIVLFLLRLVYWLIASKNIKNSSLSKKLNFASWFLSLLFAYGVDILILLQLFGVVIYPAPSSMFLSLTGFFLVFLGVSICIRARKNLGVNWSLGSQYQIKDGQQLITQGIYKYVRHPIYLGVILSSIGGEMVCHSYLSISFLAFFFVFYMQSRREDMLLLKQFGEKFKKYKKKTAMFIPYIF